MVSGGVLMIDYPDFCFYTSNIDTFPIEKPAHAGVVVCVG
jgi:hypothetical protein